MSYSLNNFEIIGLLAAILTMFSFVPQIIKVIRTKSIHDVSLAMLVQLSLGVTLWIIYGLCLKNGIIILANTVTLITLVILLTFYVVFKSKPGFKK